MKSTGKTIIDQSLYYNPRKLLAKGKTFNFVMGTRGFGKTYQFKKYVIEQFLNKGHQFTWVKRYKEDTIDTMRKFIDDIDHLFKDHTFETKKTRKGGGEIYIDDVLAGHFIPLSIGDKMKGNPFPKVKTMVYDEFLVMSRPLPKEEILFADLIETVFRDRTGYRVFLIANALTSVSRYFDMFGIKIQKRTEFITDRNICVQICGSDDFKEHKKQGELARALGEHEYIRYAIDNVFLLDNDKGVGKMIGGYREEFVLATDNMILGVYVDKDRKMFITDKYNSSNINRYTFKLERMNDGFLLINSQSTPALWITFAITDERINYSTLAVKQELIACLHKIAKPYH